ncbi:MAG: hypothetical protein ABIH65_01780 [Nanoarchaeota archaeon]
MGIDNKILINKTKLNNSTPIFNLLKLTLLTFFLVSIFPLVSAVEFDFIKGSSNFSQGETMLVLVSGNFLEQITRDNVFFYQDHVRIPMDYEIGRINNEFYIYALLAGKNSGNYSIVIKNVRYMEGIKVSKEDLVKNFTITEEKADFYVNPGFLITKEDFFLEVQNLLDKKITITINSPESFSSENFIQLLSGEIKKIYFGLETENLIFENIELSSENIFYSIPISVDKSEKIDESNRSFKFEPKTISISVATDSDAKRIIYLLNTGALDIENISFFIPEIFNPYVTVSPYTIDNLGKGSAEKIEISIISAEEEMTFEGYITATTENLTTSFTFLLNFVKDYIPSEEEKNILPSCPQINGTICTDEQKCTGNSVDTSSKPNGQCCLATCAQIEPKSSTGKYIGWGLVAIVILFLFWFLKKYKKARPKVDLLKIGQGKK